MTTPGIPAGNKVEKALRELSEQLTLNRDADRKELLKKVIFRFDLSPLEEEALRRHFSERKEHWE